MAEQAFIIDEIGGNCPVQAEGTIAGQPFYFRARGEHWSVGVGADPIGKPDWHYEEVYPGGPYAAGWMSLDEARAFIGKAAALYLKRDRKWSEARDDGQPDEAQEWHDFDPAC